MSKRRADTDFVHLGWDRAANRGFINPPVYRASTILAPDMAAYTRAHDARGERGRVYYGRFGTPTTFALEDAVAALEGGYGAVSVSSGIAAISVAMNAFLDSGDHVLVADSVYAPTRLFCDRVLARLGIETTYYDPLIGAGIETLVRPGTRVIYMESPGSLTFEVQDVPAISAVARAHGIVSIVDNTWATPLFFKPFAHGADVCLHSGTKYFIGHSDAMLGVVVARDEVHYQPVRDCQVHFGQCAGTEETYLGIRGLRTLPTRLRQHEDSALQLATWLKDRPEVARVLHPALADCPGHDLWRRDFTGASGLFGVVLHEAPEQAVHAMVDRLELFGIGGSWGGFESLIIPAHPEAIRSATRWRAEGPLLRLHVGLEDPADLIADLEAGFAALAAAANAVDL